MGLDKNILINNLEGHEDAVWGISVHHNRSELLSCSADGSVKLWSPTNLKTPCLSSYVSDQGKQHFKFNFKYSMYLFAFILLTQYVKCLNLLYR